MSGPATGKKSLAKKYQKLSHVEHVLKKPDTYVGSCMPEESVEWVAYHDESKEPAWWFEQKKVTVIPGLYKCFDELRVNALDQWRRTADPKLDLPKGHKVTRIDITVDPKENVIAVKNDGQGIDVEFMEEHQMYPAELIFGTLLTSTNYDDTEKKIVGGKNGYGAKLANIFASEFRVETVDAIRQRKISLVYRNNMSEHSKPKVTSYKSKPYTLVSMKPDLARFGCDRISDDMVALCLRSALDASAWTDPKTAVYWNGTKLPTKSLEAYADLWMGAKKDVPRVSLSFHPLWNAVVSASTDDVLQQMSWVNGVATTRGGKHIDAVLDVICDALGTLIEKKHKQKVTKQTMKNQISILLQANVVNPSFDSQTKEFLKTPKSKFGMTLTAPKRIAEQIASKTEIVKRILSMHSFKNAKSLSKTDGTKKTTIRVPKLDDANWAGTKKSRQCTLILTEGDSAKSMAISGLSVVGRDAYGVFPLRGKVLNVKQVDVTKITNNTEITNLKKILGLVQGMDYTPFLEDTSKPWPLRYGKILIMTDQDHDGFHIKGLVMNLFHTLWPSLLKGGIIQSMVTPIVKATKKKEVLEFYSLRSYGEWKESTEGSKRFTIKYYKGLGTSNAKEAKEYFRQLKVLNYHYEKKDDDVAVASKSIPKDSPLDPFILAFDKTKSNDRKKWILDHPKPQEMDYEAKRCTFRRYLDRELVQFSIADLKRSIPHMMDGFKPSQRKVLFSCLKRKLTSEIKVSQLAGYVSEHSAYHHGEMSLQNTIINMAQDYVGSNNLPLLVPSGQFGTRIMGGKDHSSPRYIFTKLQPHTLHYFNEVDCDMLKQLEDDGMKIEPEFYIPPVPLILVNGSDGIGTGWSTKIPCHSLNDVIDCVKAEMSGKDMPDIQPWYEGFIGTIREKSPGVFETCGCVEIAKKKDTVIVTELPVGTWTEDYKEWLETQCSDTKKTGFKSFKNNSTESTVHFTITLSNEKKSKAYTAYKKMDMDDLLTHFKLTTTLSYKNMHAFAIDGSIRKYTHPHMLIKEFVGIRLRLYERRRKKLLSVLRIKCKSLNEKMRFLQLVIEGKIELRNAPKKKLEETLASHHFTAPYDPYLSMPLWSITKEKIDSLKKECDAATKELRRIHTQTANDLWLEDLLILHESSS